MQFGIPYFKKDEKEPRKRAAQPLWKTYYTKVKLHQTLLEEASPTIAHCSIISVFTVGNHSYPTGAPLNNTLRILFPGWRCPLKDLLLSRIVGVSHATCCDTRISWFSQKGPRFHTDQTLARASDLQRMQPQSILKAPGKNGDWSDRIYPHATNMSIDYHFSGALYGWAALPSQPNSSRFYGTSPYHKNRWLVDAAAASLVLARNVEALF